MIRQLMPWCATEPGDVTVLRAADVRWHVVDGRVQRHRPLLTKRITPAGVQHYDKASLFEVEAWRLDCLEDFADLLAVLAGDPHACIIRGVLKPEFAKYPKVLRRCRPRPGEPECFAACARAWLMVDMDALPPPAGIDPTDPLVAGGALRQQLPLPFRGARTVVQLSSSAGLKPVLKGHLWAWLSRPLGDAEAKRWLEAAPIDTSIYQPVGIHYVANPIFADVEDPCYERLAVLPGYAEVAVPPLPEPARQASQATTVRYSSGSNQAQAYMRGCLRNLVEAPPGKGRGQCTAIAVKLYSLAKAGALDPVDVTARIKAAMLARGWSADEASRGMTLADVNRQLEWAWQTASPQGLDR
jgi:hypothetical protein